MREMKDSGVEWIGEIPIDWAVSKIKFVAKSNLNALSEDTAATQMIDYIDIGSVTYTNGIELVQRFSFDEAPSRARRVVHIGDTIISTVRTYLKAVAYIEKEYDGFIASTGFSVLTPNQGLNRKYLYYAVSSHSFISEVESNSVGISYPAINDSVLIDLKSVFPALKTQHRIADYLDAKCAQIDRAIARQQEAIEKLKEYKLSVITEAVTKGLNPDVPMKDSGIEWIGKIPEGWNVSSLGYNVDLIQTGPFGSQLHAEDYTDEGVYVINPANIQNGKLYLEGAPTISNQKATELSQHLLALGDIVFARRGEMGRCACIEDDDQYFCGTGCMKVKCGSSLSPKFAILYLQIPFMKQYLELNSVGTTMANLNSSIISRIPMIIPPFCEQEEIVVFLRHRSVLSDDAIAGKQKIIDKLTEYKKSLIYEVVTGKREV